MAAAFNEVVSNNRAKSRTLTWTIDSSAHNSSTLQPSVRDIISTDLSAADSFSIDNSIMDPKGTTFSPSPRRPKGSRVKWQTSSYNDEIILLDLRLAQGSVPWAKITELLNTRVPAARERTVNAVTNKGQELMRDHPSRTSAAPPQNFPANESRWGHANGPTPSQEYSGFGWEEMSYHSWGARCMEVLPNSWDKVMDTETYLRANMEETEALDLDAWKRRAMEAASGIRTRCTSLRPGTATICGGACSHSCLLMFLRR